MGDSEAVDPGGSPSAEPAPLDAEARQRELAASCQCGSGIKAARCCRLEDGLIPISPEAFKDLSPLVDLAANALRNGDPKTAARLCITVLDRAPCQPYPLKLLASVRLAEGRKAAVATLLQRVHLIDPEDFWALNNLALLELESGNVWQAELLARNAIRMAPENAQAHNLMSLAMAELGHAEVGEHHCRRALELTGERVPTVLANLATNLVHQGRIAEARALYEEADRSAPDVKQTLLAWARMEEADRKLDAAHTLLDRLDIIDPDDPSVGLTRATVFGREKRYDEAVALIEAAASKTSRPLRPLEKLERGRLFDRLGRYTEAWQDFKDAKVEARTISGRVYDEEGARTFADRLKGFFTRTRLALLPAASLRADVPQPLFILGFPRSGTTLLEQTLSVSPAITAGDELPFIHEIAAIIPRLLTSPLAYPEALADLWMGDKLDGLNVLRDHYLRRARHLGVASAVSTYFTDKMPLNEMHLGLIALLFPRSPLIHVVRHPLDIMVSSMSNFFTHGGSCASTLESAAKHLLLSHEVVAHYRAEMDLRYLRIRYEDIVRDQRATIGKVFAFIDVPFDEDVLAFETNPRYARTASYAQVAERLYDRSCFRYRNYRGYLEPAVTILAPLIEQLGYEL